MADLIDTNVVVYRYDGRFPHKQTIATALLRAAIEEDSAWLPHQVLVEFVAAVSREAASRPCILSRTEALREAEELLMQFAVRYPNEELLRLAIRGCSTYQLSWFDAHLWAYAEYYGADRIVSEDFQHGRLYGSVRAHNPFHEAGSRTPLAAL